jgi:hypothetical protein
MRAANSPAFAESTEAETLKTLEQTYIQSAAGRLEPLVNSIESAHLPDRADKTEALSFPKG